MAAPSMPCTKSEKLQVALLYDPGESKNFIHYSGNIKNPDLLIVSDN